MPDVSFHPSVILLCAVKKVKTHKNNLRLHHAKTAACACDIISNASAVNTINRCDVFATLLHCDVPVYNL